MTNVCDSVRRSRPKGRDLRLSSGGSNTDFEGEDQRPDRTLHGQALGLTCKIEPSSMMLDDHSLARINFGSVIACEDPRMLSLPLPTLSSADVCEVWRCREKVVSGMEGPIRYAHDGKSLFAHLEIADPADSDLSQVVFHAYQQLFRFVLGQEYPHVIRVWNVVPNLNCGKGDQERYKQFCVGRSLAFEGLLLAHAPHPAASCVGNRNGNLFISMLASKQPGIPVENPRQLPADRYPRQYGPRSPAFSRAMVQRSGSETLFHVSGTASIVGHESLHPEDPHKQLEETLCNLRVVLEHSARRVGMPALGLRDLSWVRVYVRHPRHVDSIRTHLRQQLGEDASLIFLGADICRRSLLVEIEGLCRAELP